MSKQTENNSIEPSHQCSSQSRRELLGMAAGAAVTAALSSGVALADSDHSHHSKNEHESLIDSAFDCINKGQLCMDHCMELFKQGDNSVADCADSVNEMLSMCTALTQMAAYRSKHLGAFAQVCMDVCKDCEKACREHEDKHAECKACADSCTTCIKECEKVIA